MLNYASGFDRNHTTNDRMPKATTGQGFHNIVLNQAEYNR